MSSESEARSAQTRRLERLGLSTPQDFLVHLPLRYEDRTRVVPISALRAGESAQIQGTVVRREVVARPRRRLKALLRDASGEVVLRWIHFYPGQVEQLAEGAEVRAWGEVRSGFGGPEMVHPRLSRADAPLPEVLTPVYPTTQGLSQAVLRRAIAHALKDADLRETLPPALLDEYGLMPFERAIRLLHHPPPSVSRDEMLQRRHPAWQRIKFDELLAQQLCLAAARAQRRRQRAQPLAGGGRDLVQLLQDHLSFTLTAAQRRVAAEILADIGRSWPMHRLLQGDVGSGKTVVAALAAARAVSSGAQVAIMAPTEILAEQHLHKFSAWMEPLGASVAWLSGSLPPGVRRETVRRIADGEAAIIVGTQALIQEKVSFARLGLVILDEQHRYGVGQRLELSRKGEQGGGDDALFPHQLNMSATPIPRTLAMSFLADLDVSVIDELPPGRAPVVTKLVSETRRDEVLRRVVAEVRAGRQAYWVCPLVEESEALQLQTAVDTHASLAAALPDLRLGLLHGRLSSAEKAEVMQAFAVGDLDLLVATTVIEVGVDVPKASLMVIEHAERFGLAQLHQLRGRVGRGAAASVCVLMYQHGLSQVARERLRAMYETTDGFEIARRDLEQRGPGEFLGMRQSGLEMLRFASLDEDAGLLDRARAAAAALSAHHPRHAERHVRRWMRGRAELLRS